MGRKTITVSEDTYRDLDEQRDGRVWDAFLAQLLDESTTEPEREVLEARITESQYIELYSMLNRMPENVAEELR